MSNDPPERRGGYGVERGLGAKREQLNLPVVKDSHPAPTPPPAGPDASPRPLVLLEAGSFGFSAAQYHAAYVMAW